MYVYPGIQKQVPMFDIYSIPSSIHIYSTVPGRYFKGLDGQRSGSITAVFLVDSCMLYIHII